MAPLQRGGLDWMLQGVLAYAVVIRGRHFNPASVTWLCGGDYGTQFLGWHFYRNEPLWQLPFGLVRSYGEQRGSSLVYTDSIPLFAFIFRPFSPALPHYFQYVGLW
ncbi:MAG: hypothetical protein JO279_16615, partial [Verrucomicrobia bacterium]|nr:hypothetical protein [Verrucomicrobiota bacterium]